MSDHPRIVPWASTALVIAAFLEEHRTPNLYPPHFNDEVWPLFCARFPEAEGDEVIAGLTLFHDLARSGLSWTLIGTVRSCSDEDRPEWMRISHFVQKRFGADWRDMLAAVVGAFPDAPMAEVLRGVQAAALTTLSMAQESTGAQRPTLH